ncbi:hypothetical protein NG895_10390 [Aeoliella sp. ICT_H6.2]|uniref:Uncharacterized protein n=1 Tax=Aeoliella straminimaris TaxID=2954799 RepID=A0A9X2FDH0_9BACT|nr:hypothetical protein [Aeoliella straminimaris]MCO6044314.1 hypothetical protein [Aeoliella straminimaris]
MAVASTFLTDQRKHELAEQLGDQMVEFKLQYHARETIIVDAMQSEADPDSEGHVYQLTARGDCDFPSFGFAVFIDGRDNDGDLAQSVVDEIHSIGLGYLAVAKRMGEKLDREPKPSKFRWEEYQKEIDLEEEKAFEKYMAARHGRRACR